MRASKNNYRSWKILESQNGFKSIKPHLNFSYYLERNVKETEEDRLTELTDDPFEEILPLAKISLSFEEFAECVCHLPLHLLKRIFGRADFIQGNHQIQSLVSRNFCVPDIEIAATVSRNGNSLYLRYVYKSEKLVCSYTCCC